MRRRKFIALIGAAAVWPHITRAQSTMPVVGFLHLASADTAADRVAAFRRGLREAGYVEGRNAAIEYRWAEDHNDRLPAMAADLVRRQVAVIFTAGIPGASAAKAATATIPIVFNMGANPVALGFVASLSRPGGNITGVNTLGGEVGPKRRELLHELLPTAKRVAFLVNPDNPGSSETQSKAMQTAAHTLGLELHILPVHAESEFDAAFASMAQRSDGALIIANDGLFIARRAQLGALAARHAMPAIYEYPEFAAAGGLMSYGGNTEVAYHDAGVYVGRILKGEKPADLPVMQSTKVELIINLKAAKALGITFPLTLLGRADEVIE
jgi:putative ABC transport system substrate-binding protein